MLHFIGQMFGSDLFERQFLDDWEDADAVDWKATVDHFSNEFGKISWAREQAAKHAGQEYYKKHHCNNLSEFDYALRAERNRVILRANECMGTSATSSHARVRAQND